MQIQFDEKVVLVTGASTGIGAAIAQAFGAAGASVVVHYNSSGDAAAAVAASIEKSTLIQADVTHKEQCAALMAQTIETFGRVDVLVNNAGALVARSPIVEVSDALYQEITDLNMSSTLWMCQFAIPHMRQQGGGNIINMTSISARNGGGGGSVLYAAVKAAVATFTRGLAKELAQENIRVNAISPGVILTPFHDRFTPPDLMQNILKTIPMGRAGSADECAGTALFLAADALSSYITGQIIEINGGQYTP